MDAAAQQVAENLIVQTDAAVAAPLNANVRRQDRKMLVTIATFSFPHEAHLVKAMLDAMEIPSFIADEHTINAQWLWSNAMGGVRLQVPGQFASQAQDVLNKPAEIEPIPELETDAEPESALCPHCGGALGEQYTKGKRPAFLTWIFLGFPFWPIRKVRKCTICGKIHRLTLRCRGSSKAALLPPPELRR